MLLTAYHLLAYLVLFATVTLTIAYVITRREK